MKIGLVLVLLLYDVDGICIFSYFCLYFPSSVFVELSQIINVRAFLEGADDAVPCSTCDNHGGTGRPEEKELLFCRGVAHCSY